MNILRRTVTYSLRQNTLRESCIFRFSEPLRKNNTRTFFSMEKQSKFTVGSRTEEKLKIKDKMSSTANLIYKNPFSIFIEIGFHFQRICVIIGSSIAIYYIKLYFDNKITFPVIRNDRVVVRTEGEFVLGLGVGLSVLFIISLMCKWTVLRIYFDRAENVSKAVLVSSLPFSRKIINIKPQTVTPKIRNYPVKNFRTFEYVLYGKRMLMFDDYFKTPSDLNRMLKFVH